MASECFITTERTIEGKGMATTYQTVVIDQGSALSLLSPCISYDKTCILRVRSYGAYCLLIIE